jgi:sec-independent protein translocase protein TatA
MWTGSLVQNPLMQPRIIDQQQQRGVICQGLFGLGLPEIAVIAGVAALIFGPSKLPELGKGLGKTVKSFQTAAQEFKTELEQAANEGNDKAAADASKDPATASKEAAGSKKE